ncbi:MAG: hypothetical protein PVF58_17665 [Candidatus Methanofastidiosia archaeon]|jgi:hypothetical protein
MISKAKTLSEVYDIFDPQEPLKGEKLKTYYVDRESKITDDILWKIKSSKQPLKIIFPAIRGNGNTTELYKLSKEAEKDLFVVFFETRDKLDMVNVAYVDLLLNIGLEIYKNVENEIDVDPRLKEALEDWSSKIIENVKGEQKALELGGGISALLNLAVAMKTQTSTREVVRKEVEPKLSELLDIVNRIIAYAEEKLGKLFVIIDDLDKIAPNQAEDLFFGYATTLTQLRCNILYTVPRSLQLSDRYQWIVRFFDTKFSICNLYIVDKNGNLNEKNMELMRNVALYRMEETLIDEDALEHAVTLSGGVMHDFIRIIRESAAKAHSNNRNKIIKEDIELVGFDIRNDYLRPLSKDDLDMLKEISKTHEKVDKERFSDLLFSLVIIEYLNNEAWYNVHPTLKRILE